MQAPSSAKDICQKWPPWATREFAPAILQLASSLAGAPRMAAAEILPLLSAGKRRWVCVQLKSTDALPVAACVDLV